MKHYGCGHFNLLDLLVYLTFGLLLLAIFSFVHTVEQYKSVNIKEAEWDRAITIYRVKRVALSKCHEPIPYHPLKGAKE
jgi:hypothetical protein